MDCEKYKNLINDLVDGELDLQTAEQVNLHIFSCQNCESEFEVLSSEKEMYSHFLFEIEPPKHLPLHFQAFLDAETQEDKASKATAFSFNNRLKNLFAVFNLKPILAGAFALLLAGLGWWQISNNMLDKTFISEMPIPASPSLIAEKKEFAAEIQSVVLPEIAKVKTDLPKISENQTVQVSAIKTKTPDPKSKIATANLPANKKPIIPENKPRNLVETPKMPKMNVESDTQLKQIRAFEFETAKQMEKIEMLLRAFRNVRYVEGGEEYDVAFEKQQAAKLLAKNVRLRQQAENYGTIQTNEMLSKVEPYLLEISNLDVNPSEEEVSEIKQRVKSQNIIVSLQGF